MTDTIKQYLRYVQGMSLVETLFASAVLSVVVVTGLTVTSDAIKSRTKSEARVALLTEGISTVEKARHDKDDDTIRQLLRERFKDGGEYRTLQAKIAGDEVTAATTFESLGDNQKILLRSAFAGKNEDLSTFFATTFQCLPFSHQASTESSNGSSKGSSKGNSKGNSNACDVITSKGKANSKAVNNVCGDPDPWDAHVAVRVSDWAGNPYDRFNVAVSDCTPAAQSYDDLQPLDGEDPPAVAEFICQRDNIPGDESWTPLITVSNFADGDGDSRAPGICTGEDDSEQTAWTTSCALDSDSNAASINLILRAKPGACQADDLPTNNSEFPSTDSVSGENDDSNTSGSGKSKG